MYSKRKMSYKNGGPIEDRKDNKKKKKKYPRTGPVSPPSLDIDNISSEMRKRLEAYLKKKKEESKIKPKPYKKGGKTDFGMLSVKAGYDNNPNPTAADRIVGAKKKGAYGMKMKKKSMGMGGMKMKSTYKHGGRSSFRGNHQHD